MAQKGESWSSLMSEANLHAPKICVYGQCFIVA